MFRISLDALLILDAIDRRGSFSAAGLELHRVPSTISYTVSKLEQDLGVQVFERDRRSVWRGRCVSRTPASFAGTYPDANRSGPSTSAHR